VEDAYWAPVPLVGYAWSLVTLLAMT